MAKEMAKAHLSDAHDPVFGATCFGPKGCLGLRALHGLRLPPSLKGGLEKRYVNQNKTFLTIGRYPT